jgi:ABC-type glutathione transport system ATPase component
MKIIGLTGIIGSGKSTLAQYLKQLGPRVSMRTRSGMKYTSPDGRHQKNRQGFR